MLSFANQHSSGKVFIYTEILEEQTLWFEYIWHTFIPCMGLGSVDVFMCVEENFTLVVDNAMHSRSVLEHWAMSA